MIGQPHVLRPKLRGHSATTDDELKRSTGSFCQTSMLPPPGGTHPGDDSPRRSPETTPPNAPPYEEHFRSQSVSLRRLDNWHERAKSQPSQFFQMHSTIVSMMSLFYLRGTLHVIFERHSS